MRNLIIYKIILLFTFSSLIFSSCNNNDEKDLFNESVNERFEKIKDDYINTLTQPENGWIGYYAPNAKSGGFVILFKFDKEGNVKMASDYKEGESDNISTYRIDKRLKVELVFETQSILSQIYEIGNNGVEGEYVFHIESVKEDEIILKSATDFGYDGSGITELKLRRAKPEYWEFKSVYENTPKLANGYNTSLYFRKIYVEGTDVKKTFSYVDGYSNNELNRYAEIKGIDENGKIVIERVSIVVTYDGFKIVSPFKINKQEVSNFTYDEETNRFISNDGGQKTIIEYSETAPVIYYPDVSIGEDGKFLELMYRQHWATPGLKQESSPDFLKLYSKSKASRIYIMFNSDADGELNEIHEAVIMISHPIFTWSPNKYRALPLNIKRIENDRVILSLKGDLETFIPEAKPREDLKVIIDVLTDPDGFHIEKKAVVTILGAMRGYYFIGTKKSNIRFPVIDTAFKPA